MCNTLTPVERQIEDEDDDENEDDLVAATPCCVVCDLIVKSSGRLPHDSTVPPRSLPYSPST